MSQPAFDAVVILLGALAFDLAAGEPPAAIHPVVWMGRLQSALRRLAPRAPGPAFVWGAAMALLGPLLFGGGAWWLLARLDGLPRDLVAIYLLKSAFAARGLAAAALAVRRPLGAGDLDGARAALGSLVSRDRAGLPANLVAAAAIESVAENASDSIVAPLLWYAVGGVPAALAYRAINTLDAMIGYRGGDTEWLGKAAARLDDVANVLPARLTALLVALASPAGGGGGRGGGGRSRGRGGRRAVARALAIWWRDRRLTASPNAGHPMAAMAGALGVQLEKTGAYRLGAGLRAPGPGDIDRAVRILAVVTALAVAGTAVIAAVAARGDRFAG